MSIVAKKIMMGSGATVDLPSDDQFNRTSFLSHFDGSNNGVNNQFTDGSTSNHTVTAAGNVTQGSFGPFARPDGEWAVDLVPNTGFLRAVGAGDISGDFTVETWVFMNKDNGNYIHLTYNVGGLVNVFNVYNGSVQNFLFGTSSTGGQTTLEFNDTTWDAGVWTHLAMVRSSGTLKIYVNGVADATTTTAVSGNLTDLEYIGTGRSFTSDSRIFDGKVSNVRFSSTARYTSNFTPPTAPFTTDSDTNLLTCQSNRFVDNSSNGHTITPAGSAAVTAFGPFLTSAVFDPAVNGGSGYFDGSGDALRVSDTASLRIGTGQYTIECWFWFDVLTSNNSGIFAKRDSSSDYWRILATSSGVNFRINSDVVSDSTVVNKKCWNHIAITRDSNNDNRIYVNGSLINTISSSVNISNTGTVRLGEFEADTGPMTGYICDARIVIGTAVYTGSSLTPPTAPLTAITNTKLLLNMADGQAIDSTAQNNLNLFGTAKTSTAQYKFGTASLLLDGNSDYATFPETGANDIDGGVNWTVEFFWRFNDKTSPTYQEILTKGNGFQIYTNGGSLSLALSSNNSGYDIANATGGTTLDNDVWYHLALVKNGTSYKLYLNGTSDLSATSSSNLNTGGFPWFLGTLRTAETTYPSNGYMDEVRISKFARYTSNFTAPTEPFADKGQ